MRSSSRALGRLRTRAQCQQWTATPSPSAIHLTFAGLRYSDEFIAAFSRRGADRIWHILQQFQRLARNAIALLTLEKAPALLVFISLFSPVRDDTFWLHDMGTTIHPSAFPSDLFADSISNAVSSLTGLKKLKKHTSLPSRVAIATEVQFIRDPTEYVCAFCSRCTLHTPSHLDVLCPLYAVTGPVTARRLSLVRTPLDLPDSIPTFRIRSWMRPARSWMGLMGLKTE